MEIRAIFCCDCTDIIKNARAAYKIIAKRSDKPQIVQKRDIHSVVNQLKANSKGRAYIEKLMKRKGKFCEFIHIDDCGEIVEKIELNQEEE